MPVNLVVPLVVGAVVTAAAAAIDAASAAPAPPPAEAAAGLHTVTFPAPPNLGPDMEHHVVLDIPGLKIVAITLRSATPLPEHRAPTQITLQAIHGTARVIVAGITTTLSEGRFVVLDANVPHTVQPEHGMVTLLVHNHKRTTGDKSPGPVPTAIA